MTDCSPKIEADPNSTALARAVSRRHWIGTLVNAGAVILAAGRGSPATAAPVTAITEVGTVWWSELVAKDAAKAIDFYGKVINWTAKIVAMNDVLRPPSADDSSYTIFQNAENEVAGVTLTDEHSPGKNRPVWITYFQVENVDAAIARALAAGGQLVGEPFNVESAGRMALLLDLEGIPFGVASP